MMSSVEPFFGNAFGEQAMITANKYFTLENFISKRSDINGTCKFDSLTVKGGISTLAYFMVSVDGVAKYWNYIYNPTGFSYELPPRGIQPISLEPLAYYVYIIKDFPI